MGIWRRKIDKIPLALPEKQATKGAEGRSGWRDAPEDFPRGQGRVASRKRSVLTLIHPRNNLQAGFSLSSQ